MATEGGWRSRTFVCRGVDLVLLHASWSVCRTVSCLRPAEQEVSGTTSRGSALWDVCPLTLKLLRHSLSTQSTQSSLRAANTSVRSWLSTQNADMFSCEGEELSADLRAGRWRGGALTMGQASAFGGSLRTLSTSDSRTTFTFLSRWGWCLLTPPLRSPAAPPPGEQGNIRSKVSELSGCRC